MRLVGLLTRAIVVGVMALTLAGLHGAVLAEGDLEGEASEGAAAATPEPVVGADEVVPAEEPGGSIATELPADAATPPTDGGEAGAAEGSAGTGDEDSFGTGEESEPTPTKESQEGSGPIPAEEPAEGPQPVLVTVTVYNCDTDPAGADPVTAGCDLPDGVVVTATENGSDLGTFATVGGVVTFDATEGSQVVVSEDPGAGYRPIGSGTAYIDPVTEGASVVFVNLRGDLLGRLQLINGSCPTSGDERTEFIVIAPDSFQAAAEPECAPTAGAVFIITGGSLGGAVTAVTDEAGVWRGYLPAGFYTVTDDSGAFEDGIAVVVDDITIVIVIDYFRPPTGALFVEKWVCTEGDEERTDITVSQNGGDPDYAGEGSCRLSDGEFRLEAAAEFSAEEAITFTLGADGTATLTLPIGAYVLTDLESGESAEVAVVEGATTRATVRTISLHGTLVVRHYFCADPASADQDPAVASYWLGICTQSLGGVALTLYDGNGDPVDTQTGSGGGVITWKGLVPGTYRVDSADGLCAAFSDWVDVRAGFGVAAGATTLVRVYSCATADDGDGDGTGNNGGNGGADNGTGSGGNDGGGDGTGNGGNGGSGGTGDEDGAGDDDASSVTELPQTGVATGFAAGPALWLVVLGAALGMGALGLAVQRRPGR